MSAASTMQRRWVTRAEAAELYGLTTQFVDRLRRADLVRAKKNGRNVLIEVASLDEWVDGLEDA